MVLRTLAREPMHGYGITLHIQTAFRKSVAGRGRFAVPSATPHGAGGLDPRGVGHLGEQSPRPLLPVDRCWPQATCRRGKELGATHLCRRPRSAVSPERMVPNVVVFAPVAACCNRDRLEKDLDEELRSHLEMRAADNLAAGMTPEEAGAMREDVLGM